MIHLFFLPFIILLNNTKLRYIKVSHNLWLYFIYALYMYVYIPVFSDRWTVTLQPHKLQPRQPTKVLQFFRFFSTSIVSSQLDSFDCYFPRLCFAPEKPEKFIAVPPTSLLANA